jgi:hypothetical protein
VWKYDPASCSPVGLPSFFTFGQDQDVVIVGMVELVDHMRLRRAEATRERDELRGVSFCPRSTSTCPP